MATLDVSCKRGATFRLSAVYKDAAGTPINLTGYTARMALVDDYGAAPAVDISHVANAQGKITLGGVGGTIEVEVKATATATLVSSVYALDFYLIEPSGSPLPLFDGNYKSLRSAIPA